MRLSEQVVSLELAKKLKRLNVTQESAFYWVNGDTLRWGKTISDDDPEEIAYVSAYSVAELGELLPFCLKMPDNVIYPLKLMKNTPDQWHTQYKLNLNLYTQTEAITMADSMAKMLIYLLENGLITRHNMKHAEGGETYDQDHD